MAKAKPRSKRELTRIVTKVVESPWLITGEGLKMILDILDSRLNGETVPDDVRMAILDLDSGRDDTIEINGGVGILRISGPIFPKANLFTELSGATDLEQVKDDFRALLESDRVDSILLDFDTPGGVADMVPEMGAEIFAAREIKPVVAVANTLAASAGAWLATQAGEFYGSPSSNTGSIGVYTVHQDDSVLQEKEGVKQTIIKAGRFKAAHLEALTPETREMMQGRVNELHEEFLKVVAEGRNTTIEDVRANYGEGSVITAKNALKVGMIDGIQTFDEVLSQMQQTGGYIGKTTTTPIAVTNGRVKATSTATSTLSLSHDVEKEHGDPGPQGEPIPKESPEKDDKAIKGGWRVPTPPPSPFPQDEEGSAMDREQLVALAELLKIEHKDVSDEDLFASVKESISGVVVPLEIAGERASAQQNFEKDFPEQARRLRALEEKDEEVEARLFSERWARFEITEGDTKKKSTNGFSSRTLEHIEKVHLSLARRELTADDLAELFDSIGDAGIVDYAEKGSSRTDSKNRRGAHTGAVHGNLRERRAAFADAVEDVMKEDSLDRKAAIAMVAERDPELFHDYKYGHLGGRS